MSSLVGVSEHTAAVQHVDCENCLNNPAENISIAHAFPLLRGAMSFVYLCIANTWTTIALSLSLSLN